MLFLIALLFVLGCNANLGAHDSGGIGGGRDAVTFDLPFSAGYTAQCVQGAGGSYSHSYNSTRYDIDLDTPNDSDDPVYAPYAGTAYIHTASPGYGFGIHINIDLGDGTYVVLGHLDEVLINDGEEVALGQLIGVEGTTGYSTGDHLHLGRHEGSASDNGSLGTSIEGMTISAYDVTDGREVSKLASELTCDLSSGHTYRSELQTPLWHPNGTLVKTYDNSRVYLLEAGQLRHFQDESVFWSYNYSFENVVVIDDGELACYNSGNAIGDVSEVRAVQDNGTYWLLIGQEGESDSYSQRIGSTEPERVLESWGIIISSLDDLPEADVSGYVCHDGYVQFRDGSLISEDSDSTVYLIADGVAMPIVDWSTYLLMDFHQRNVITVADGTVSAVQERVGNCSADLLCLTDEDVFTCGGPSDVGDWGGDVADEEEADDDESDESDDEAVDTGEEVDADVPDDLRENLSWIHVDGDGLGLTVSELFNASVDGEDVAVTGYGFPLDWGYNTNYLVDYDSATDIGWYNLSDGKYRMTMRTAGVWADLDSVCGRSSSRSDLCHLNQNGTYSLCLEAHYGELWPLSTQECQEME